MTAVTKELVEIVGGLPEDKARAVVDFARFLQQQAGDREWECIITSKREYPKLDKFVAEALHEGNAEPLDPDKLSFPKLVRPSGMPTPTSRLP